ncbi:hypothetical protein [Halomonas rhizosphaerae]|uniref:Uncharacterized protein n=1 Tax=Halomonas rhizosphaerae TaxID=3043296 RepID=A0ABT6V0Q1_9GAMM|nr:hypothetical protein [Halomonas rhizosphaerae]MDI5891812.1 hypothetical protein [Halomonas rhizosphaerae]
MTYGYRLNVEQLMLRRANNNFYEAKKRMVEVPDSVPESGEPYLFKGPGFEDDETIALCIEAILGWAISFEAFVNLVWHAHPVTKEEDERNYRSTIAKLKRLYKFCRLSYGNSSWRAGIQDLFDMRNYLVHYKDPVVYIGFNFAAKFQHDFSENSMQRVQCDVLCALKEIGDLFGVEAGFVDGDYDHLVYKY